MSHFIRRRLIIDIIIISIVMLKSKHFNIVFGYFQMINPIRSMRNVEDQKY